MAAIFQEDGQLLLERSKELRKENLEVERSVLVEIASFLNNHQAETAREATHVILENFPDWWVSGKIGGRRAPPGLYLQHGSQDEEELYKHAATLFGLGMPLTLAERRSPVFRLFQDLDIWGSAESSMDVEQLLNPESVLVSLIGKAVGEVFPPTGTGSNNPFLDASIYDASGTSQTKGLRKTSIRLVWPAIHVDADRALRFRDFLISKLQAATAKTGEPTAELEAQLRQFNPQNSWHNILGDAAYGQRSAVRMPLNDRVAPLPLRNPEARPFTPVGVMRFNFDESGKLHKMKVEWLCRQGELESADWLKIGCVRLDEKTPLTEWVVPSLPVSPMMAGAARGARVKVRTQGGSDGGGGLRMARGVVKSTPLERAGQIVEVHRRFGANWNTQTFCERMDKQCGQSTLQPDGTVTWKNPTNDARIEMHEEDRKITVVGKPNQVRSLIVFVSQFTEACPGLATATANQNYARPQGYNAPGSAFAPAAGNSDEPQDATETNADDQAAKAADAVGQLRVAHMDFVAEGAGELTLKVGDRARVTYDDASGNADDEESRWVYGKAEDSEDCGWFPLDHTKLVEETTEREQ
jgi:hypothetical protein